MENRRSFQKWYLVGCGILLVLATAGCAPSDEVADEAALDEAAPAAADAAGDKTVSSLGGILYAPDTAPELVSMVPQKFEASAEIDGQSVELVGDYASWIVGGVSLGPGSTQEQVAGHCQLDDQAAQAECGIRIVRFGHYGTVQEPIALTWLAAIEGSATAPTGTLTTSVDGEGNLVYPAKVHFDLPLVFTLQRDGESEPVTLRSRTPAAFDGHNDDQWPMGLTVVDLSDGPVTYYREADLDNPDASPFMTVTKATIAFADKPSEFFRGYPQITQAQVVDAAGAAWQEGEVGGVQLEWTDTTEYITSSHLDHFNVYRNLSGGSLDGWTRIATVPATQTAYTDGEFDSTREAAYLVTHDVEYPFDRFYEGVYGQATVVAPVEP